MIQNTIKFAIIKTTTKWKIFLFFESRPSLACLQKPYLLTPLCKNDTCEFLGIIMLVKSNISISLSFSKEDVLLLFVFVFWGNKYTYTVVNVLNCLSLHHSRKTVFELHLAEWQKRKTHKNIQVINISEINNWQSE